MRRKIHVSAYTFWQTSPLISSVHFTCQSKSSNCQRKNLYILLRNAFAAWIQFDAHHAQCTHSRDQCTRTCIMESDIVLDSYRKIVTFARVSTWLRIIQFLKRRQKYFAQLFTVVTDWGSCYVHRPKHFSLLGKNIKSIFGCTHTYPITTIYESWAILSVDCYANIKNSTSCFGLQIITEKLFQKFIVKLGRVK